MLNASNVAQGKAFAILTSGGDAQGMNASVRGAVRMAISLGAKVYGVRWGYQGLIDGGENIFELTWDSVDHIIHLGGTFIGSARCTEFRTTEGRKKAALNLINHCISGIIVIGGDGSLSGADLFRREWPTYIEQFIEEGVIAANNPYKHLNVVGIVGSIDNDFCGTDMTIGADSALHRIVECTESIRTTAQSHQRAFVLEVMGRNSGYLGLISGIACGADYVFIPECPPSEKWREEITESLNKSRQMGKLYAIVIIAEGATDINGSPISSSEVRDVIAKNVGFDTRSTVLGHVQRGGTPSAFDRILATRFGVEAVVSLCLSDQNTPSYVMCLDSGKIVAKPLMQCVNELQEIKNGYKEKRFEDVVSMRGATFQHNMSMFRQLHNMVPKQVDPNATQRRIGLVCVGAVAPGSTSLCRSIARSAIAMGDVVIGFEGGFPGMAEKRHRKLSWNCVEEWIGQAGSVLGTSRVTPVGMYDQIAAALKSYAIDALIIVGGFEGMVSLKHLCDNSTNFKEFDIPMVHVPVTMSNNVPGTYISIGADSSLNVACAAADQLKESGRGYSNRVYVVDVMGKKCGYLAVNVALASGADDVYIFEEKYTIEDLMKQVSVLKKKVEDKTFKFALILKSDECSKNYDNKFIASLINEEIPQLNAMPLSLGYIQQGISPSPFDRFKTAKLGVRLTQHLNEMIIKRKEGKSDVSKDLHTVCVLEGGRFTLKPVDSIYAMADIDNRSPKSTNILKSKQLAYLMAGLEFKYQSEAFPNFSVEKRS